MEVAGAVVRRVSLVPHCATESSDRRKPSLVASFNGRNHGWKSGEQAVGSHRQLAGGRSTVTCGEKKERKEKRKLVKGLTKDLEMFAEMGFGIDPRTGLAGQVQRSMMTEASEVLLRQLQSLRKAEEEAKRRRKQEKKQKAKATQTLQDVDLESSTDSGDGGCSSLELLRASDITRQVRKVLTRPSTIEVNVAQPVIPSKQESSHQLTARPEAGTKKVEICMGGKCKKSGGSRLLEQFQRLAENEDGVNVVGCKCMGKCKNGPNVRLSTSNAAPAICSGVEMGDVDALMSSFLELS